MASDARRRTARGSTTARVLALAVLAGAVLAAVAAVSLAVRGIRADPPPPPPPPPAVAKPREKVLRIVFPEGFTRAQMASRVTAVERIARTRRKVDIRLSARAYLAATRRSALPGRYARDGKRRALEGFLFPATYRFTRRTTTKELVARQLEAFGRAWKTLDLGYARSKNLTRYDVLIIASLVEKETVAPEERPLVAAVVYNRLKARMPLGIDATIRYGLGIPGTEPLHESQLASDNPYNTRKYLGLPPTPIANPGLASLRAAAKPSRRNYLYFVRKPDKVHHFFTASEAEFLRKACEYGYGCG